MAVLERAPYASAPECAGRHFPAPGSEAGARCVGWLGRKGSPDTLLRRLSARSPPVSIAVPRVLGGVTEGSPPVRDCKGTIRNHAAARCLGAAGEQGSGRRPDQPVEEAEVPEVWPRASICSAAGCSTPSRAPGLSSVTGILAHPKCGKATEKCYDRHLEKQLAVAALILRALRNPGRFSP